MVFPFSDLESQFNVLLASRSAVTGGLRHSASRTSVLFHPCDVTRWPTSGARSIASLAFSDRDVVEWKRTFVLLGPLVRRTDRWIHHSPAAVVKARTARVAHPLTWYVTAIDVVSSASCAVAADVPSGPRRPPTRAVSVWWRNTQLS